MGAEFIDKAKGTYQKTWASKYEVLCEEDLFTIPPEDLRTVIFHPVEGVSLCPGEYYELQVSSEGILAYKEQQLVAVTENPPKSITRQIIEQGGKALGLFHRDHKYSRCVDIAIRVRQKNS